MDRKGGVLMQRYELGKLLGQGNFAKVYHGRNIETGVSVAVKIIDKEKVLKVGMMNQIKREISVMRLVKHPNVVQLYEVMASKTKIYFVLEYVKGGELFNKVAKGKLKEDAARNYFQQLISAIDFCHSRGVYHRDLKPENLLVDDDGNLKISDFGLSALAETKRQDGLLHTACGTPAYIAPEVFHLKGYDGAKADIWSCGVVLFVLLAGFLPFHDLNLMEMYRKIARAEFKYPNWFPTEARRLVSKILDPNSETRISIAKIMENSWFTKGFETVHTENKVSGGLESRCQTKPNESVISHLEVVPADCMMYTDLTFVSHSVEVTGGLEKVANLNAFDIISLSPGFNLRGLFNNNAEDEEEVRFMSKQPVTTIVSKLEEIAKSLKMQVMKNNGVLLKMERSREGKNGVLAIDVEIFELTPNIHLIEAKRSGGDRVEFGEIMIERMRSSLMDVV
ncbi:CBL-interacting protein kinase 2-like [Cynara cardunculus var. scolymus]|uniref:CBL-interacting protein kinase 2-like n=1 Tax=Cynara cardunculus var. scolymus TaxID=59895 RepID=UPI000D6262B9|nr:CBL-interacting protein kinase 2-like [Cynara cardunculus var. scolymus]